MSEIDTVSDLIVALTRSQIPMDSKIRIPSFNIRIGREEYLHVELEYLNGTVRIIAAP